MEKELEHIASSATVKELTASEKVRAAYPRLKGADHSTLPMLDVALVLGAGAFQFGEKSILKVAVKYLLDHSESQEFKEKPVYQDFINFYLEVTANQMKSETRNALALLLFVHVLIGITIRYNLGVTDIILLLLSALVFSVLAVFYILRKYSIRSLDKKQIQKLGEFSDCVKVLGR